MKVGFLINPIYLGPKAVHDITLPDLIGVFRLEFSPVLGVPVSLDQILILQKAVQTG